MTVPSDPWTSIQVPGDKTALNILRADAKHPLDYWLARDFQNQYLFYLEARVSKPGLPQLPKIAGIEVAATWVGQDSCRLILTLGDYEQFELFRALCTDLMNATRSLKSSEDQTGLQITLARLRRWQELLKKSRDILLSDSKIMGLIGELTVLRDIMVPRLSVFDAAQSWRGPYGDEQDFLVAGWIMEVKTQLSTSDKYVAISSENQLDTVSGSILLCHQTFDVPAEDTQGGQSLNGLVQDLFQQFASDPGAVDLFRSALLEAGYELRPDYDRPLWIMNHRTFFAVSDGFPRIIGAGLGPGIDRVQYRLSLDACSRFEISEASAIQMMFPGGA